MKRVISLLLTALLVAALLVGCAGVGLKPITPPTGEAEPAKTEANTPSGTEAPKTEPAKTEPVKTEPDTPSETEAPKTEPEQTKPNATEPIGTGIAGLWKYTLEFGTIMETEMLGDTIDDPSVSEEQKDKILDAFGKLFRGVEVIMCMDLKEDGSYEMKMDEDSLQAAADQMSANIPDAMPDLLCAMIGCELDELNEILSTMGVTMDDMVADMSESLNPEEMMSGMDPVSGEYTYEDNELVMVNDEGNTTVMTAELNGNELIVTDIDGESELNEYGALFPMIFVR